VSADPTRLAGFIAEYNGWPEEKQANGTGSIIGQFTALFRRHPDRLEAWLVAIESERIVTFAIVGLGLAGDPARAEKLANERKIDPALLASTLLYRGGPQFFPISGPVPPIGELLARNGTIETMKQRLAWHQDVLWAGGIRDARWHCGDAYPRSNGGLVRELSAQAGTDLHKGPDAHWPSWLGEETLRCDCS
jgi:hypothetical protein